MFMSITTEGARVNDNGNKGLTEAEVTADVATRNERAEALGIKTRYKAADFERGSK